MQQCLVLARQALEAGNPPVGAVIALGGTVIGTGIEAGKSSGDITSHAEIMAIRSALANGCREELREAVLITTHEPCIMCSYAIRHHGIPEIVYGVSVPHVGGFTSPFGLLTTEDVPQWGRKPRVIAGVCAADCEALSREFAARLNAGSR